MNCLELLNNFPAYYKYEMGIEDRHALNERYSLGTLMSFMQLLNTNQFQSSPLRNRRWYVNHEWKPISEQINSKSNQHADVILNSNCNNGINTSLNNETNSVSSTCSKESFSNFYALKSDQARLGKYRSRPKYKQRISAFEFTSDQSTESATPTLSNQTPSDLLIQANHRTKTSSNRLKAKICRSSGTSDSKQLKSFIKINYTSGNKHNSKVSDTSKLSENSGTSNDIISSFEEDGGEQNETSHSYRTDNLLHIVNKETCNSDQQLNSLTLRSQCSSCTTTTTATLSEIFDDTTTCSQSVGTEISDIYNGPSLRRVRYIGTKLPTHKWHRSGSLLQNKLRKETDSAYLSLEHRKCYTRHYIRKAVSSIHNVPLNFVTNKSTVVCEIAEKRTVSEDFLHPKSSLPSRQSLTYTDMNKDIQICSPKRLVCINEAKQSITSNESEGHMLKEAFAGHDIQTYFIATCTNKLPCDETFSHLLDSSFLKAEHLEYTSSSERQKFSFDLCGPGTITQTEFLAQTVQMKSPPSKPEKLINIILMKTPALLNSALGKHILKNNELSLNSTEKTSELDINCEETSSEDTRQEFLKDSETSSKSPSSLIVCNPEETNIITVFTTPEYTHLLSSLLHLHDTDKSEVKHSFYFAYLNDGPSESHGDSPRNTISHILSNIVDNSHLLTPRTHSIDSELTCLTSSEMLPDSYFSKHSHSQSQDDIDLSQSVETMPSSLSKHQLFSFPKEIFGDCEKIVYWFSNTHTTPSNYAIPFDTHIFPEKCVYFEQILFGDTNITSSQSVCEDRSVKQDMLKESLMPSLADIQMFTPTAVNQLKQNITDIQEICSFNKTMTMRDTTSDSGSHRTNEISKNSLNILKSRIFDSFDIKKAMSARRTSFTEITGFNYMDYPIFKEHFDKLMILSKLRNGNSLNTFCNIGENLIDWNSQISPISTTTTMATKQQVEGVITKSKENEHSASTEAPGIERIINKELINLCDSINVSDLRYGDAIVSSCQSSKYQLSFNDQKVISSVVKRKVKETPSSLDSINKPKFNKATSRSSSLVKAEQKIYKPVKPLNRTTNPLPNNQSYTQARRNKHGYENSTVAASVLHNKVRHLSSNRSTYSSRPKRLPSSNMTNGLRKPSVRKNVFDEKQDSKNQYGPLYFSYFMNDLHLSGSEDHNKKDDSLSKVLQDSKKTVKKVPEIVSVNEQNKVFHETIKPANLDQVTNNSKSMNLLPTSDIVSISTKTALDKQDKVTETGKYVPSSLREISDMNRLFRRTNTSPNLRCKIKYPHGKTIETRTECSKEVLEEDLKEQTENWISSIKNETTYDKRTDVGPRAFSPLVSPTVNGSDHHSQRKSESKQEIREESYHFKKTEFWCCGIWRRSKSHAP
ncbi:unnamed protein product [Trichobilharzia szidati]|nr:unnamed protein product [Trichobilharzia szidati]